MARLLLITTLLVLLVISGTAQTSQTSGQFASGQAVGLAWDAPVDATGVVGYYLVRGTVSGSWSIIEDVGNALTYTLNGLPDGVHYIIVKSYNSSRVTSGPSNEVIVAMGVPLPGTGKNKPSKPGNIRFVIVGGDE